MEWNNVLLNNKKIQTGKFFAVKSSKWIKLININFATIPWHVTVNNDVGNPFFAVKYHVKPNAEG